MKKVVNVVVMLISSAITHQDGGGIYLFGSSGTFSSLCIFDNMVRALGKRISGGAIALAAAKFQQNSKVLMRDSTVGPNSQVRCRCCPSCVPLVFLMSVLFVQPWILLKDRGEMALSTSLLINVSNLDALQHSVCGDMSAAVQETAPQLGLYLHARSSAIVYRNRFGFCISLE